MALVRRDALVGSETFTQPAVGIAPAPAGSAIYTHRETNGVTAVRNGPDETADDAAAAPSPPASVSAILAAFALIAVGTTMAYVISSSTRITPFRVGDQTTTFGILLVFAAAVERLLEPFTQRLPGRQAKAEYESLIARLANRDRSVSMADVAQAKARVDRDRASRVVVVWGLATAVATVLCAGGGFLVLRVLENDAQWHGVSRWIDALVTGLIVGSGTKPLHDLIVRLQKGKEKAEDGLVGM
jgi:hypothetical protein